MFLQSEIYGVISAPSSVNAQNIRLDLAPDSISSMPTVNQASHAHIQVRQRQLERSRQNKERMRAGRCLNGGLVTRSRREATGENQNGESTDHNREED